MNQMTVQPGKRDLLLSAAQVLVMLASGTIIFAMVMALLGAGIIATVQRSVVMARIAEAGAPAASYALIFCGILIVEVLLYLALRFLMELRGVIASVGKGDPFHPENANRLSRMGWMALIGQVLMLPLAGLAVWLEPFAHKIGGTFKYSIGLDGGTMLLILVLFILARVFRHGSALRDEVDGTV